MNKFDWQTEENDGRPFELPVLLTSPLKKKRGRKLLLLTALLALIVFAFYWQLDRRADAQTAVFEADVLAAHENRLQTAEVTVQLSPDWTSAEIGFEQVYNIIDHPVDTLSTPRQIRFAQNIAFRRNADRPTFSLVGRPVDDTGYSQLYQFYTRPILDIFTSWVDTPIPLPDQELQLICYPPEGRVPKLVRFVSTDEWIIDLPEQTFRYLSPMATDAGVILQQYLPGEDSSRLRLVLWRAGEETLAYDDTFSHLMLYPVGWSSPLNEPNLLLHGNERYGYLRYLTNPNEGTVNGRMEIVTADRLTRLAGILSVRDIISELALALVTNMWPGLILYHNGVDWVDWLILNQPINPINQ